MVEVVNRSLGSCYGIDSKSLLFPREAKKTHPRRERRVGAGLPSKLEDSLSYLDRATTIDRVQFRGLCEFVMEGLS